MATQFAELNFSRNRPARHQRILSTRVERGVKLLLHNPALLSLSAEPWHLWIGPPSPPREDPIHVSIMMLGAARETENSKKALAFRQELFGVIGPIIL
jgi:hypothetical protein